MELWNQRFERDGEPEKKIAFADISQSAGRLPTSSVQSQAQVVFFPLLYLSEKTTPAGAWTGSAHDPAECKNVGCEARSIAFRRGRYM